VDSERKRLISRVWFWLTLLLLLFNLAGFNSSGTCTVSDELGTSFEYEYVVEQDNVNYRTIAGFSTDAKEKMWDCDACPYNTYSKFFDYYGEYDYADQIISAAFNGTKTNLKNGNSDFSLYTGIGRTGMFFARHCLSLLLFSFPLF
jgi:hypothetical protein